MLKGRGELGNATLGRSDMERHELREAHWLRLEPLVPGRPGGHGRDAADNRNFLNAVRFMAKNGGPWRDLPERFGKWDTVYHRFNQWCKKGVWQRLFEAVSRDADMEWLMPGSTVVRAHPHAAGMNDEADDQALGRSRGGFGTKIHLAVDALGNPVTVTLSPGQDADISHAPRACWRTTSRRPSWPTRGPTATPS